MKKLMILAVSLLVMASCAQQEKKVHINECRYLDDIFKGVTTVTTKDSTEYSGKLWSTDEKTACLDVENGVLKSITFYHANGQGAMVTQIDAEGGKTITYYDENGTEIDFTTFHQNYNDLIETTNKVFADEAWPYTKRKE